MIAGTRRPVPFHLGAQAHTAAGEELIEHADAVQDAVGRGRIPAGPVIGVHGPQLAGPGQPAQPPRELADVLGHRGKRRDVQQPQERQPLLQIVGTGPQGVRRVLAAGAQRQVVVHQLDDPPVIIDEGAGLPPCPGPQDLPYAHPIPSRNLRRRQGNRLTNTSAPGVIHGSSPSSEAAWLTSLTPCAPVQVKAAALTSGAVTT